MPQPRPALRRAPDADVHPAMVIPIQAGLRTATVEVDPPPAASPKKNKKAKKAAKATKAKKAKNKGKKPAKAQGGVAVKSKRFLGAGRATSDVMLAHSPKRVALNVKVPRGIRDEIREVSRMSGASEDDLVSELLSAGLSDPRRW